MTLPQTLNVEYDELLARADELAAPLPAVPIEKPQAPCALKMAIAAADQLELSADNMRLYLGVGEREDERLAESLRNAAKAYGEVDDDAATALNTESTFVAASRVGSAHRERDAVMLGDTKVTAMGADPNDYADLKQTLWDIEQPDQGAALVRFAHAWIAYRHQLEEAAYRFRPFRYWDGDATAAVEASFDQERSWMYQMGDLCITMATQALNLAAAQDWAVAELASRYATYDQVLEIEDLYACNPNPEYRQYVMGVYAQIQVDVEEVLTQYARRARLPLAPVQPPKPPVAYHIDPPSDSDPSNRVLDVGSLRPGPSDGGVPDPTGIPRVPSTRTPPMPPTPDASTLTDASVGPPSTSTLGSGLKPASFGGGGGGNGVPPMPLQSPVGADSASRTAAGALGVPGPGRGVPGRGGAMRGGMGGMAPMAPGQGQNAGKPGKRVNTDDESLYIERRKWTEGVVGVLRPSADRVG